LFRERWNTNKSVVKKTGGNITCLFDVMPLLLGALNIIIGELQKNSKFGCERCKKRLHTVEDGI
jgi:hypothetical protein